MNEQTKRFYVILFATICWIVVMRLYSPPNIVEFEFAKTVEAASAIINDWGTLGVAQARTSTYLDFIFLILYSSAISLGCRVASRYSKNQLLVKIGIGLSWVVWIAGICDMIENIAMLKTLSEINQTTISIAYYFAGVKFSIVFTALAFILLSYCISLIKKK